MTARLSILLGLLFLLCSGGFLQAQENTNACAVCGKFPLTGKVWRYKDWLICDDCVKLKDRCSLCGLPARPPFTTTGDGRVICQRCEPTAILKLEQAQALFAETKDQIVAMTRGRMSLQQPNITLSMFDIDYWNVIGGKPLPDAMRRPALSQTRGTPQGYVHNVLLWSGMTRDDTRSCLAHEYTHLWINENLAKDRKLVQRTVEGLCELIAYKLDEELKLPDQLDKIRKNPYTQGRILDLIDLEQRYSLNSLLLWVQDGQGEDIEEASLGQPSPVASIQSAAPALVMLPQAKPTPEATLLLRGVIGSGKRLALINDRPFIKGEKAQIRLSGGLVTLTCLDILDQSVVIQVEGEQKPRTLWIGQ